MKIWLKTTSSKYTASKWFFWIRFAHKSEVSENSSTMNSNRKTIKKDNVSHFILIFKFYALNTFTEFFLLIIRLTINLYFCYPINFDYSIKFETCAFKIQSNTRFRHVYWQSISVVSPAITDNAVNYFNKIINSRRDFLPFFDYNEILISHDTTHA